MVQRWFKAEDTFVATRGDGTEEFVAKGATKPESDELVIRDQKGSGTLFRPLDLGENEKPPAKSAPAKPVGKGSLDGSDPAGLQAVGEHGPADDGRLAAGVRLD
jgi:hypothetical protein